MYDGNFSEKVIKEGWYVTTRGREGVSTLLCIMCKECLLLYIIFGNLDI